jgi:uncharacterized protein (PEP-CTERM system associated)
LTLNSRSGRVQGSLNYTLNALFRSRQSEASDLQNALSAHFTAEAIEHWAYIDAQATITQQSLSAYGVQTQPDSTLANANRAEVGTASLSPYLRGMLGAAVHYELRLNGSVNEVRHSSDNDSITTGGSVALSSASTGSVFGWGFNASRQGTDYKAGRKTTTDRASLSLSMRPDPDLLLNINAGQEATDVGAADRRRHDNWGYGGRWTPTDRSSVSFQSDRRYFGRSHSLTFEHRMQRSVWSYSDLRDATSGSDPNGVGRPVTLYQLFYAQFASAQPDPTLRDQMVLDFLRALGRDPGEVAQGGLLNQAVTVQRRQDLSFAWLGVRTTFNIQAFASSTRTLDGPAVAGDPGPTRLSGYNTSISYRLTPASSLTLNVSRQATAGNAISSGNVLESAMATWAAQPGRLVSTSISARRAVFSSETSPYRETSVSATLGLRF